MKSLYLEALFRSRVWKALSLAALVVLVITLTIAGAWIQGIASLLTSSSDPRLLSFGRQFEEAYLFGIAALCILAFLALAALADLYYAQRKTRRFSRMADRITAFASGDRNVRLKLEGGRDERALAASFNQTAERLCQHLVRLERLDEFRRELISYVAHDLGGPVTSIQGCSETLAAALDGSEPDVERARRMSELIGSNVRYLGALVRNLSELARLDEADFRPAWESFSVHTLALDVASRFASHAEEAGVRLEVADSAPSTIVNADLALIERVLTNLITNALRHTPAGGRIVVSVGQQDGKAVVHVIDTGCGISKRDLPFVFEQFFRIERDRSRRSGGSGLGLAIARRILAAHGCSIEVHSEEGRGSDFHFDLPLAGDRSRREDVSVSS